jgi:hypothetical protein
MRLQPILAIGRKWAEAERHMDAAALDTLLEENRYEKNNCRS